MKTETCEYDTSSIGYLARAEKQLKLDRIESIFYAALEIRCAIEARAREQLLSLTNIPKNTLRLWHAKKILIEFKKIAKNSDKPFSVELNFKDEKIASINYIPIGKNLIKYYEKLGDFLHSQRNSISVTDLQDKKKKLKEIKDILNSILHKSLLKPPIINIVCPKCQKNVKYNFGDRIFECGCGCRTYSIEGQAAKFNVRLKKIDENRYKILEIFDTKYS